MPGERWDDCPLEGILRLKDEIVPMCSCQLLFSHRSNLNGITLNGIFYVTGGTDGEWSTNEVLAWDSESETWNISANMREPRDRHAVTLVRYGGTFYHS